MELKPIGLVKSPVTKGVDENWGQVVAEIHLEQSLAAGLKELDQFRQIIVLFYMDKSTFNPETDLIRRPQGRSDMPEVGIFAQRAKHRPNPIGITTVELISIQENVLTVKGLDAIDGTPVLDLKPYYPDYDWIANPSVPQWVETLMENYFNRDGHCRRMGKKRMHLIARAVILQDNHLLLARHKGMDNTFLPGGHSFVGEGLKAALKREVREELDVDLDKNNLLPSSLKMLIRQYAAGEKRIWWESTLEG